MARQPFLPKFSGYTGGYGLTPGELAAKRPLLAQIIGDCTAIWPYIEHDMALALSGLLNAKSPAALGVFIALRGFRTQKEVIEGAARVALSDNEQRLLSACLTVIWTAQKARDDIAHGLWGVLDSEVDTLMWISGADYGPWNAASLAAGGAGHGELLKKCFVYTKQDLLAARDELLEAREISFEMALLCLWEPGRPDTRAILSEKLMSRPRVKLAFANGEERRSRQTSTK